MHLKCDLLVSKRLLFQMGQLVCRYVAVDAITEPAARAAAVFIYGEYGQAMPEAPYMLEPLLEAGLAPFTTLFCSQNTFN